MGHRDYMRAGFSRPSKQRNIVAFVGNGFDIQAMRDYKSPIDTRYQSFYHFLKLRSFDQNNLIFREMETLKNEGKENWSDIENVVGELLSARPFDAQSLGSALLEIQGQFSEFLNLAVPSELLVHLGKDSMDRKLAISSLAGFLGDLELNEYRNLEFRQRCDNFDIYNFVFFNFNYTSLFDNFIYLDQKQFDPMPRKTVDRNFDFRGNPRGFVDAGVRPNDTFSSYVMTDIVHPHGSQGVPRSLLFGIDTPPMVNGNRDLRLRLAKPFWAQNERRYGALFEDTELFIVFGCSLGESDRWWWKKIAGVLGKEQSYSHGIGTFRPELIVYWYSSGTNAVTSEDVRKLFLDSADSAARYEDLRDCIRVVLYGPDVELTWLSTAPSPVTP